MASYGKGGADPDIAKNTYDYEAQDIAAVKEGTSNELPGEQLQRGLHSRQVSMIAIGKSNSTSEKQYMLSQYRWCSWYRSDHWNRQSPCSSWSRFYLDRIQFRWSSRLDCHGCRR
jgi:hypothetical protein